MKEIADSIFVENELSGVTLGAIIDHEFLTYIDAPLRPEHARSWRSSVNGKRKANPSLVMLDSNLDRTIGSRYMECPIIAHEQVMNVYQERPITFKPVSMDSGADWEKVRITNGFRWIFPEIVFSQTLDLVQSELHIQLQYHPGPSMGNTWVIVPEKKVMFLGDTLMNDQIPFLQDAEIEDWQNTLSELADPVWKDYTMVSGRSGIVEAGEVEAMQAFLTVLRSALGSYAERSTGIARIDSLIPELKIDKYFKISKENKGTAIKRLTYGLRNYYVKHYQPDMAMA